LKSIRAGSFSPLTPPPDSDVRRVLDSVRRVVRVLRLGSRAAEKQVGLSSAQLFVLQKLAEARGLSVNELAERTHTHQSSVSVVVQRLADRGLVARVRSAKDARQMRISVTPSGRAALRGAPEVSQNRIIDALRRMPAPRRRQLAISLQALVDLLGVDKGQPAAMLFEDDAKSTEKKKVRAHARSRSRS
jgi:DNA-binding MarR family transcriptional regulator